VIITVQNFGSVHEVLGYWATVKVQGISPSAKHEALGRPWWEG